MKERKKKERVGNIYLFTRVQVPQLFVYVNAFSMIIACHECQEFSDTWLGPLHVWATTLGGMLCCTSVAFDAASPGAVATALWESVYMPLTLQFKEDFCFQMCRDQ